MEFHIGSQAPKVPPKIAISHALVISGGNILSDKAQKKNLFSVFLVEFQLYFTGFLKLYVIVLLLKKYLTSTIEKNVPHGFFCNFMNPLILERKFSQPGMS